MKRENQASKVIDSFENGNRVATQSNSADANPFEDQDFVDV
jgi:hypothetical protein